MFSGIMAARRVAVRRLPGLVGYLEGMQLQRELMQRRRASLVPDTLLLLEHPPVFTLGRLQQSASNVLVPPEAVRAAGASVVQSDRGGNVTFHGPGQLVAYPILDLGGFRKDMHWFVGALEDAMIGTAATFGIVAERGGPGRTGVWVSDHKVGAIGVRVSRWVSSHGIALNANVDLSYFDMIVPCGLNAAPDVTSLSRELARTVTVDEVVPHFEASFAKSFSCELVRGSASDCTVEGLGLGSVCSRPEQLSKDEI